MDGVRNICTKIVLIQKGKFFKFEIQIFLLGLL